jgi:hypothetical protein
MTKQEKENFRLRNAILNSYFELTRLKNKLKFKNP